MGLPDQIRAAWRRDRAAVATPALLFVAALFLYTRALGWGLPAGDETWAADAIRPSAPLAVAFHNFVGHGFDGGWFWFKYPPFHAFVLAGLYAPYLAWLWLTGGISGLQSDYPFGMADPVTSLSVLALIGRTTSALMGAGSIVLVYACLVRGFGRTTAAAAALVTALAYPMVFYAQTTNVEVPYLFWLLVALLAATRLVEGETSPRWWATLGVGAALSVSTKELSAGAFVGMPIAILAASFAARRSAATWIRGGLVAAVCFAVALLVANNALYNPTGFLRRLGFLTQTLPEDIALRYAPYYFPIDLGGARGFDVEFAQVSLAARRLLESLGWPTLLLGFSGFAIALGRRPWWVFLIFVSGAAFYLVSVRAMLSLSMRYVLPLTVFFSMGAGIALGEALREGKWRAPRIALAAVAAAWVFAYGWDVNRMLCNDGRYRAEQWMAANAAAGTSVEIYQPPTYLPHLSPGLNVSEIPFEERNAEAFAGRRPDLVLLSSAGLSGVAVQYKEDWQESSEVEEGFTPAKRSVGGVVMSYTKDANARFLEELTAGRLGYEEAAHFVVEPWIPRPLIQSLNPSISIYRRVDADASASPTNGSATERPSMNRDAEPAPAAASQ